MQQQIIGCSTDDQAAGAANMRIPTLVGKVSSWFSTWTLTQITCSGSAPAGRVALSGAPGASRRRDTPHSHRTVREVDFCNTCSEPLALQTTHSEWETLCSEAILNKTLVLFIELPSKNLK